MKSKVIKTIKNILYYAVILFLTVVIAISLFIPNGLVKVFGVGWYRVVSESMEPQIMTGDYIIVVKNHDVESFKDGDIIIFETHFFNRRVGTYVRDVVTHHFYKVDENGFILTYPHSQYDKLPEDRKLDEWHMSSTQNYDLKASDIIGRHQLTIPMSGLNNYMKSPFGLLTIFMGIVCIISLMILLNHFKQKKDKLEQLKNDTDHITTEESDIDDVENLDA